MSKKQSKQSEERKRQREERRRREAEEEARRRKQGLRWKVAGALGTALLLLLGVFLASGSGGSGSPSASAATGGGAGEYPYAVGNPASGEKAPQIMLPATDGGTFDLAAQRGKSTLLYFQEGLMCQPCWDQITDLEPRMGELRKLGVDQLVSITSDPVDAIEQKVVDEGIDIPVLSDEDLAVSRAYETNLYGMMGEAYNGHSFILVGPDGRIRWRADYGGDPNYFMYIPVPNLLADMREGMDAARQ